MPFPIMPHANIVELGAARSELHLHTVLSIAVRNCTLTGPAPALGQLRVKLANAQRDVELKYIVHRVKVDIEYGFDAP